MLKVYYAECHGIADDAGYGATHTAVAATEKKFFDRHKYLADGPDNEPNYDRITAAFQACGWPEECESFYMGPKDIAKLKEGMAAHGIELIENPALIAARN